MGVYGYCCGLSSWSDARIALPFVRLRRLSLRSRCDGADERTSGTQFEVPSPSS